MEDMGMNRDFWSGKRVLVTGHTGFKGSWLAHWLHMLGAEVCGYALSPDTEPSLFTDLSLASRVDSHLGDVRDLNQLRSVTADFRPDIVFHLAAQSLVRRSYKDPVGNYATNVMGTVNVLEAVRQTDSVSAAVIVTTDKVYENTEHGTPFVEADRLGGFDPYASSKACAELVTAAYRNSFFQDGPLVATARAGNVIGGGDWSEDRLLPDVFRSMIFGEKLVIRNPDSIRPWQHVLEPLRGYITVAERLYAGDQQAASAWNFGPAAGEAHSVRQALDEIADNCPEPLNWGLDEAVQPHESKLLSLDSSRAWDLLGVEPKLDLAGSIKMTAEWYLEYKRGTPAADIASRQIREYEALG